MEKETDYTKYGDGWVNLMLDLSNAVKTIRLDKPHSIFYVWQIAEGEEQNVGYEYNSDDTEGFINSFIQVFKQNKVLIPLITTAIAAFIDDEKDETKRLEYKKAIDIIMNSCKSSDQQSK